MLTYTYMLEEMQNVVDSGRGKVGAPIGRNIAHVDTHRLEGGGDVLSQDGHGLAF